MKKFKDFIYDKNDIIIAVLILAVAALIIAWRLDVILQYPKQLINNDADTNVSEPADNSGDNTDTPADNKDTSDDNADTPADNSSDGDNSNSGDNANNGDSTPAQLWVGGKLSRDIEVDVTGTTASAAVQCLIDKGLFTDYSEYQKACENLGLNHEKVSAGTMTFTKGSTKADVARKINWS